MAKYKKTQTKQKILVGKSILYLKFLSHSLSHVFFFSQFHLEMIFFFSFIRFLLSSFLFDSNAHRLMFMLSMCLFMSCLVYCYWGCSVICMVSHMFSSSIDCGCRFVALLNIVIRYFASFKCRFMYGLFFTRIVCMKSPPLIFFHVLSGRHQLKRFYFISNILSIFLAWIQHQPLSYSLFVSVKPNAAHFTVNSSSENSNDLKTSWKNFDDCLTF